MIYGPSLSQKDLQEVKDNFFYRMAEGKEEPTAILLTFVRENGRFCRMGKGDRIALMTASAENLVDVLETFSGRRFWEALFRALAGIFVCLWEAKLKSWKAVIMGMFVDGRQRK